MLAKMLLSTQDSQEIQNMYYRWFSAMNCNTLPRMEELQNLAFTQLEKHDFIVERVLPNNANCIIRVFNKLNFLHDNQLRNVVGFNCFTKKTTRWTSVSVESAELNYDWTKCQILLPAHSGEHILYDCEFFDTYVYVSKKTKNFHNKTPER